MVATNACGGNAFRYGYTRDHVAGLGVVWDDGTLPTFVGRELETRRRTSERIGTALPLDDRDPDARIAS